MIQDPYAVLGVSESAGDDELKKAYREKSKKWHPDSNPGNTEYAEQRFKEVQEAYRQIVDARARGESAYGPAPGKENAAGSYGSPYGSPYGQREGSSGAGSTGYAEYGYGSFADFFDGTEKIYSAPHPFTIKGKVYGRTGYNDGDKIYTSNIVSIERAFKPSPKDYFSGKYSIDEIADFMENDIFIATTQSGSKYAFEKKALGANMYMYLGTWSNGF